MASTLQQIIERRSALTTEQKERAEEHASYIRRIRAELAALAEAEALLVGGLDLAKIERGRALLSIEGRLSETRLAADYMGADKARQSAVRQAALADAKADLAEGGTKIQRQYFGVKNYSGFGDQREDHQYGYGPKHGSIVFSISRQRPFRNSNTVGCPLTPEQIDDALYLLSALPEIERLQTAAKEAA